MQLGSVQVGSVQLGSVQLGSVQLGSLKLGSLKLGSVQLGSVQLGSVQLGSAQPTLCIALCNLVQELRTEEPFAMLSGKTTGLPSDPLLEVLTFSVFNGNPHQTLKRFKNKKTTRGVAGSHQDNANEKPGSALCLSKLIKCVTGKPDRL